MATYRIEITDEVSASSAMNALVETLERLEYEENIAVVTNLATGEQALVKFQAGIDFDISFGDV